MGRVGTSVAASRPAPTRRRAGLALAALAVLATTVAPPAPASAGELVPGLAPRTRAGHLVVTDAAPRPPSVKVIDGDPCDWIGTGTGLAGSTLVSAGELIYEDFLFDGYGADDGTDLLLAGITTPIVDLLPDLDRPLRQGPVLAGILTNSLIPGSRPMRIGDAATPPGRTEAADLAELRLAPAADGGLDVLVEVSQMRRSDETAVLVLLDLGGGAARHRVPFGSGLHTTRAEVAALVTGTGGVTVVDLRSGATSAAGTVAVRPDGDVNAIEAHVPLPDGAGEPVAVAVATGYADAAGTGFVDIGPGSAPNVANVAFRREPVSVAMDEAQALLLTGGTIDAAFAPIDLAAQRGGATQTAVPGPGYYEAHLTSTTPGVATEAIARQGARQAYGLYLPTAWRPGTPSPTTMWLHYAGGDTHHLGAFLPNLVRELGEERGDVLISPSGRGESSFYGGAGYADVLEVLTDSDRFGRDPDRTSLSGYSMGSYGTMLLTALHPDLWAGALAVDGTPPSYFDGWGRITANAAPVPFVLMGLLAYSQMRPDYEALRAAGGSARIYLFPTDHYTNIVLDEWTELTRALGHPVRDAKPERVRYTRVPAVEAGVAKGSLGGAASVRVNPAVVPVVADGAFWVDGIQVRAGDPASLATFATVDATTDGFGHRPRTTVPELALSAAGAATPYLMEGVRVVRGGVGAATVRASSFRATLTNVAAVRFDLTGMGLCDGAEVAGSVTTDGPATITFDRGPGQEPVTTTLPGAGTQAVAVACGPGPAGDGGASRAGAEPATTTLPTTGAGTDAAPLLAALALVVALGLRRASHHGGAHRATPPRRAS